MKILYLAHRLPYPPNKGDKLRSFHELAHLAQRHDVWCASFVDDPNDFQHVGVLAGICRDVSAVRLPRGRATLRGLAGLLSGRTVTEAYYDSSQMRKKLAEWSDAVRFDAVLAFSSSMAGYALSVDAPRRVIDFCDLDSLKWLEYGRRGHPLVRRLFDVEGRRLAARERYWARVFDRTILITGEEATPLADQVGTQDVLVAGNGVVVPDDGSTEPLPDEPVVGFVGAMDYKPNVEGVCWFCREVWPQVRAKRADAVFQIVGRSPTRGVRRLARVPGVQVVGPVDDVGPWIRGFRISVAPLHIARGLQNKVLEALAWGRPVVTTSSAACGIAGTAGETFVVADEASSFSEAVVTFLHDGRQALEIARAGRQLVSERHDWSGEMEKIEAALIGDPSTNREPRIVGDMPVGAEA